MSTPLEDRLRAHFAERAANEHLPGPEADTATQQAQLGGRRDLPRAHRRGFGSPRARVLLAAAVVVAVAAVAGALTVQDDPADDTIADEPDRPSDPDQSPSPTDAPGATTSTSVPLPADTPTTIVSYREVLGTWTGSAWEPWSRTGAPPEDTRYDIVQLDDPIATATGTTVPGMCPGTVTEDGVDLGLDDRAEQRSAIAVSGVDDPQPRPVDLLSPSDPAYRQAATAVLAGLGITDPDPPVRQVIRTDLDSDGTAEVLVTVRRGDDPQAVADGDYSVAFLRRVVDGDVETQVIDSSVPPPPEGDGPTVWRVEVTAVADLNGDGNTEVVVEREDASPGGISVIVYELQDGELVEVLRSNCGV